MFLLFCYRSKTESQRQRTAPGVILGAGDRAEIGVGLSASQEVVGQRGIRVARVEVVERVKGFYPELQSPVFLPERELLVQAQIPILEPRPVSERGRSVADTKRRRWGKDED